jgi:hypothetical protein
LADPPFDFPVLAWLLADPPPDFPVLAWPLADPTPELPVLAWPLADPLPEFGVLPYAGDITIARNTSASAATGASTRVIREPLNILKSP